MPSPQISGGRGGGLSRPQRVEIRGNNVTSGYGKLPRTPCFPLPSTSSSRKATACDPMQVYVELRVALRRDLMDMLVY